MSSCSLRQTRRFGSPPSFHPDPRRIPTDQSQHPDLPSLSQRAGRGADQEALSRRAGADRGGQSRRQPLGHQLHAMLDMANDSHLFADAPGNGLVPLYEAKMIHQFDHRWATYEDGGMPMATRRDAGAKGRPELRGDAALLGRSVRGRATPIGQGLGSRLADGWRDICRATDERTVIASVIPRVVSATSCRSLLGSSLPT
jgi:hypothetical protein